MQKLDEFLRKIKNHLPQNMMKQFKENNMYKKYVFVGISCIIMLVVLSIAKYTTGSQMPTIVDDVKMKPNAFEVYIGDHKIGIIRDKGEARSDLDQAGEKLEKKLGKQIEIEAELTYNPVYVDALDKLKPEKFEKALLKLLENDNNLYKKLVYAIELDTGETVFVENEENIVDVFNKIAAKNIPKGNSFILKPLEYKEGEALPEYEKNTDTSIGPAMALMTVPDLDEEKTGANIVDMGFIENIKVKQELAKASEIVSVDQAVDLLTEPQDEKETYSVAAGDCLSIIGEKVDMPVEELLKLNPGITEKTILQIGQELNVMIPKPALSVALKEEVVYTEPVEKPYEYKEDSTMYKTHKTVLNSGADGVKEITAMVTKVDGFEENREIVNEEIIQEPETAVVLVGTKELPPKGATGTFIRPTNGVLTSPFGYRWGKLHTGIDLASPIGTSIMASDGGTVIFAGWSGGYGKLVKIDHGNDFTTYYGHCSKLLVTSGEQVSRGEVIAEVGSTGDSTGPHVHFEIRIGGDPINPFKYLN